MANLSGSERLRTFMAKTLSQGMLTGSLGGVVMREQSNFRRLNSISHMIRLLTVRAVIMKDIPDRELTGKRGEKGV